MEVEPVSSEWIEDEWIDDEENQDTPPCMSNLSNSTKSLSKLEGSNNLNALNPLISFGNTLFGKDISQVSRLLNSFLRKKDDEGATISKSSVLVPLLQGSVQNSQRALEDSEVSLDSYMFEPSNLYEEEVPVSETFSLPATSFNHKFRNPEKDKTSTVYSVLSFGKGTLESIGQTLKTAVPSMPRLFGEKKTRFCPPISSQEEALLGEAVTWRHKIMEVLPVLGVVTLCVVGTFAYLLINSLFNSN